jgi:hypothetical protein
MQNHANEKTVIARLRIRASGTRTKRAISNVAKRFIGGADLAGRLHE